MSKTADAKVLLLDLEVSHAKFAMFTPGWRGTASYKNLLEQSYILSAAWKWLGEKDKTIIKVKPGKKVTDRAIVQKVCKVLEQADAVVWHNGDRFDKRVIAARALINHLPPPAQPVSIDTCKIAKKHFLLDSNSLDHLLRVLGYPPKRSPGQDVWLAALLGSQDAVDEIAEYNGRDIDDLEKIFYHLRPFSTAQLNMALLSSEDPEELLCPACGSDEVKDRGSRYNKTTVVKRFKCDECGHWFTGGKRVRSTSVR